MPASEKAKLLSANNMNILKDNEVKTNGGVEKAVAAALQVAREDAEVRGKIAEFLLQGMDKQKLKEKIIEEVLKDPDLRKKIMLEIVKRLD